MLATLHPETLSFLKGLKKNNNKVWFDENRATYDAIRKQLLMVLQEIIEEMASIYPELVGVRANDCLFRINRDIRFSNNKNPYKLNLAAGISPGGRKSVQPGFYLHIEPNGASYIGGGLYRPETPVLKAIRQEIDYNGSSFLQIVRQKKFVKSFGDLYDDKINGNPRGYQSDNEMISWLRYKSFIAGTDLSDIEIMSKDLIKNCVKQFALLMPLIHFLKRAVD